MAVHAFDTNSAKGLQNVATHLLPPTFKTNWSPSKVRLSVPADESSSGVVSE
jgi:hypothetical protein